MSLKSRDKKNRWRDMTLAFRVSPEEAYKINLQAKTSGLTKQDFILKKLLDEQITVYPNIRVQKYLQEYLTELTTELSRLEKIQTDNDILDNIKYVVELISKM